jgi:hypothetical protein
VVCGAPEPPQPQREGTFSPPPPSISDFSISKVKQGVVWTVSTNGQIYETVDGGKHWNNVSNIGDVPPNTNFNTIEAGDDVNTAYVTGRIRGQRGPAAAAPTNQDEDVPLIWRTTDGGQTWTSIVRGLPRDERTHTCVELIRVSARPWGRGTWRDARAYKTRPER